MLVSSGMATKFVRRARSAAAAATALLALSFVGVWEARAESAAPRCSPSLALRADPARTYPEGRVWRANGTSWICPCDVKPCLWMCCPKGMAFNESNSCVGADLPPADLDLVDDRGFPLRLPTHSFHLRHEEVCPGQKLLLDPLNYPEENYTLFTNGKISVPSVASEPIEPGSFCVGFSENMSAPMVMVCIYEPAMPPLKTAHMVYASFMILSLPFLAATFAVYAMLPRLQNLHGKIVMSNVASLFVAYLTLIIVKLASLNFSVETCKISAFIIYFAFLASFFWLNVMCLDIWWTFSGFRPMRGSVKEREHKKFIIYSLYCWGSPLIMLIICMIMDLHPGIPDNYEKPGFGELKCWFRSNMANFIYFSGPIAILIVCNIILFILTAVKIRQVKRGTKILKKQDSRRHNEEEENNAQRFNLYLKLFLVMGVNWIMEIVSFAAGGPDEYWYITDIANTLQGVLIFIIFVWKDRIRKLLVERFCPSRAVNSNSLANSSSTRTTAIRHNGSVMSSGRPSFRNNKEDHQMKTLTTVRSDDSDIA